ncbi:hypothetical protein S1OALGB6SA_1559, partial [Olavius algarvensis spirochete endosymbiont]|uniref:hypothetical protein n=1 Tax=Olavius algarvensis spirochete endosymbiont TaxID=260710 RepID=UPI000F2C9AE5
VGLLRQGSDIASAVGEGAAGVTLGAVATGAAPVAVGAAAAGLAADAVAVVMSSAADIIEGELTSPTITKGINLGLSLTAKKFFPGFNKASKRFHHVIGSKKGQFATGALGKLGLVVPSAASVGIGAASDSLENKIDEVLPKNDRNDQ